MTGSDNIEKTSLGVLVGTPRPLSSDAKIGYHIAEIPKGKFGESSKILEEVRELIDAEGQGIRVMQLCELSDIIGAIVGYLDIHFPDMSISDLMSMASVTERAFKAGARK